MTDSHIDVVGGHCHRRTDEKLSTTELQKLLDSQQLSAGDNSRRTVQEEEQVFETLQRHIEVVKSHRLRMEHLHDIKPVDRAHSLLHLMGTPASTNALFQMRISQ